MLLRDGVRSHPKVLKAGAEAAWLWACCIDYSRSQLTDGFVPSEALPTLANCRGRVTDLVGRLVDVGLLHREDGGVRVHDYLEHNDSADEVKADKDWDRRRKELYSDIGLVDAIKARDQDRCRYCGVTVNWKDRRGPRGGQFDHIIPRGANTADNVVVCCRGCNIAKGGRSPEQAGMRVLPAGSGLELGPNQVHSSSDSAPTRARGVGGGVGTDLQGTHIGRSGSHKAHALCGQVCLPAFLFAEFVRLRGGDEQQARDYVERWWLDLDADLAKGHGPIGNEVTYLRQRWEADHPVEKPAAKTVMFDVAAWAAKEATGKAMR